MRGRVSVTGGLVVWKLPATAIAVFGSFGMFFLNVCSLIYIKNWMGLNNQSLLDRKKISYWKSVFRLHSVPYKAPGSVD